MNNHLKNLEKHVLNLKNKKILDLGSGRGDFLIFLAKNNYDVIGLEKNKKYIEISKEKGLKRNIDFDLLHGRAEDLPFKNNYFDFINCSEVTEHVEDPEKLIKECYRVLKKNGQMYISFHNRFGIYDYHYHLWFINWLPRRISDKILRSLNKEKTNKDAGFQELSKMHYYTYIRITKLLFEYNFKVLDTRKKKINNKFIYNLIKHFIPTYHFIVEK